MENYKKLFTLFLALSLLLLVGCGQEQDLSDLTEMESEVEDIWSDDEETCFDGWWVRPWDYDAEAILPVDYMFVDGVAGVFTVFTPYGDETETFSCYVDDDHLTLDLGDAQAEFLYDSGSLLDPETGTEEYVAVFDPGFLDPSAEGESLDGTWYRLGDLSGNQVYELKNCDYEKRIEGEVVSEGTFMPCEVTTYLAEYFAGQVLTLNLGDGLPSLYPIADGTMLLEEDGYEVYIYTSEEAAEANGFETYAAMEALLNTAMVTEDGDRCLYFYPSCFKVMECSVDDWGDLFRGDTICAGDWTVADGQIYLIYDDGTEEWLDLPDEDFALFLPSLDRWFYPQ